MTSNIVAAFDFDGTLTYHDTLMPFILYCEGKAAMAWKMATISPYLALDILKGADRQVMKERVLTRFFAGHSASELRQKAESFAADVLPLHLKSEGMQRLRWHQQQGHRCILVSASIDLYLEPWVRQVGFNDLVSSRLAIDAEGRVTGSLIGKNCRGSEKVRRLEELLGPKKDYTLYAYGDSRGDRELLALADYPFLKEMPHV